MSNTAIHRREVAQRLARVAYWRSHAAKVTGNLRAQFIANARDAITWRPVW